MSLKTSSLKLCLINKWKQSINQQFEIVWNFGCPKNYSHNYTTTSKVSTKEQGCTCSSSIAYDLLISLNFHGSKTCNGKQNSLGAPTCLSTYMHFVSAYPWNYGEGTRKFLARNILGLRMQERFCKIF